MKEPDKVNLVDILNFMNDPFLPARSKAGIQKINTIASRFQFELQDLGDSAVDYVVMLARDADVDWDAYRQRLTRQARILDLIANLRTQDDLDGARLIAKMSLQLDRIATDVQILRDGHEQADGREVRREVLYSRQEAAKRLGISISTIDREIRRGYLRTVQVGRRVMISGNDLLAYRDSDDDIPMLGD